MEPPNRICVARIRGAVGVRGEVRLATFVERLESLSAYGELESGCGTRRFAVRAIRPVKGGAVARLEGIRTRNEAEVLKGLQLYVPRNRLPEPGKDEHYHADLIGMLSVDLDGNAIGRVQGVHNFGAGDVLEILPDGRDSTEFVPFTREAVPRIEPGRIVLKENPVVENGGDP